MKKYSKRLLALLLACIMVLVCGTTVFAIGGDLEERMMTPKPEISSLIKSEKMRIIGKK